MQACLKSGAKMGHRGVSERGGWRVWAFLRDMQVTETESGNSDGLHSQALFRCVTSPHLYVRPDVYRNGSAAANLCKAQIRSFLEEGEHTRCFNEAAQQFK